MSKEVSRILLSTSATTLVKGPARARSNTAALSADGEAQRDGRTSPHELTAPGGATDAGASLIPGRSNSAFHLGPAMSGALTGMPSAGSPVASLASPQGAPGSRLFPNNVRAASGQNSLSPSAANSRRQLGLTGDGSPVYTTHSYAGHSASGGLGDDGDGRLPAISTRSPAGTGGQGRAGSPGGLQSPTISSPGGLGGGNGVSLPCIGSPSSSSPASPRHSDTGPVVVAYAHRPMPNSKSRISRFPHKTADGDSPGTNGSSPTGKGSADTADAHSGFMKGLRRFFGIGGEAAAAAAAAEAAAAKRREEEALARRAGDDLDLSGLDDGMGLGVQRSAASVAVLTAKHAAEQQRVRRLKSSMAAGDDGGGEDLPQRSVLAGKSFTQKALEDPKNPAFRTAQKLARVQAGLSYLEDPNWREKAIQQNRMERPTPMGDGWK
ncbi:hypothetical protein HYH03_000266 [Edaphochlamys debaryana]|uniref:Uncharacterized protein n=1 Tax=Edaphochlamys debaryana TaxID=47281 RepID=A0A835YFU0_9CHLO|nr:hypothetical protein HYH03_000266 [Edaphochlamys debaryana]|eukprot:KAG2501766.1 hypothetical protein HYH03_000266 [Edaphochlamys debaryana]